MVAGFVAFGNWMRSTPERRQLDIGGRARGVKIVKNCHLAPAAAMKQRSFGGKMEDRWVSRMRYLVRARIKPGCERSLANAIESETLGAGSVAGGEYLRNMREARRCADQTTRWVEVCYCPMPLQEERPYWEQYFELTRIQDAHDRRRCRDQNGSKPWACGDCDCTERLERKLETIGKPFLESLQEDLITLGTAPTMPAED
jgi:hypothetical protein